MNQESVSYQDSYHIQYKIIGHISNHSFSSSDNYMDELTAAGVFMYQATNEQKYLDDAESNFGRGLSDGIEWNNKGSAAAVSMHEFVYSSVQRYSMSSLCL